MEFVLFRCNILSLQHHVKLKDEPTYTLFIMNVKKVINYCMNHTCGLFFLIQDENIFPWKLKGLQVVCENSSNAYTKL